jgi:hypothetical protein
VKEVHRRSRALLALLWLLGCGSEDPASPGESVDGETQVDAARPDAARAADASMTALDATSEVVDASEASRSDASSADAAADAAVRDAATADAGADASAPGVDAGPAVRYADVATILSKYCVVCHSAGGKAPFWLDNYDEAADNGAQAYAAASARIMPPCAEEDPSCGPTNAELATLRGWVLQGTPE